MPTNEVFIVVFERLSAIASGSWSRGRSAPAHSPNACGAKSLPSRSPDETDDLAIGHFRDEVQSSERRMVRKASSESPVTEPARTCGTCLQKRSLKSSKGGLRREGTLVKLQDPHGVDCQNCSEEPEREELCISLVVCAVCPWCPRQGYLHAGMSVKRIMTCTISWLKSLQNEGIDGRGDEISIEVMVSAIT
jgi:hypothetical protein